MSTPDALLAGLGRNALLEYIAVLESKCALLEKALAEAREARDAAITENSRMTSEFTPARKT